MTVPVTYNAECRGCGRELQTKAADTAVTVRIRCSECGKTGATTIAQEHAGVNNND